LMLSLEEKIGQMCMAGFYGLEPPDYILEWLATGRIGGVILFSRNIESPEQVAKLTQACHAAARYPILIGIDQEGGTVARLHEGFTQSPGAMALGASGSDDIAYQMSKVLATEMRALGINWNFAPVVDLTHDINNPSVGTRSLGTDKGEVSRLAIAEVRGFQDVGVAACAKHFPGLGNTPIDTHEALAVISDSLDELLQDDLVPFQKVIQNAVASVMVTHVMFDALDNQYPATLSPVIVTKLLREMMGFAGVAATDCMEMKAIVDHYSLGESAVLAALAGQDLILFSHTRAYQEAAYEALLTAVESGRLSIQRVEESVERIQAMKARFGVYSSPDMEVIRSPQHLRTAETAARAGVVLLKSEADVFPLQGDGNGVVVIEFASYLESKVAERRGQTAFETLLRECLPAVQSVSLRAAEPHPDSLALAHQLSAEGDVLVIATRSAHLIPEQLELARTFMSASRRCILLCLRNPYDVDVLPAAGTVICTCGDSSPSVQAAVDALLGVFTPTGKLPVPLTTAFSV
jgi:beta-N-acetylhexosaminidase